MGILTAGVSCTVYPIGMWDRILIQSDFLLGYHQSTYCNWNLYRFCPKFKNCHSTSQELVQLCSALLETLSYPVNLICIYICTSICV